MTSKVTRTVLIIDDSPDDLEFYSRLLTRANSGARYKVLTAADSSEGLKLFETHEVDCSLVDYNLPDQDGLATVKALQEWAGKKNVPIVMLTGEPRQEVQAEAARSGALDYVVKDAINSFQQLERVIDKAIDWSKSLQE